MDLVASVGVANVSASFGGQTLDATATLRFSSRAKIQPVSAHLLLQLLALVWKTF